MEDSGDSRRAFLKASTVSATLTAFSGCSGLFQERDAVIRYEHGSADGVVVKDVPESDGPLLYATTITTQEEMEQRLNWNAAYGVDTVSSVEDTDFAGISFKSHFLTTLISAFNFQEVQKDGNVLPVEFRNDFCIFPITFNSLPPMTPTDEAGNRRGYYTAIYAWSRGGQPAPEQAKIELTLTPTQR